MSWERELERNHFLILYIEIVPKMQLAFDLNAADYAEKCIMMPSKCFVLFQTRITDGILIHVHA